MTHHNTHSGNDLLLYIRQYITAGLFAGALKNFHTILIINSVLCICVKPNEM